ncbi:MerR family transcriptional regulator [Vibrio wakamikoensis]|uniref:MerR family transcriptional regulator n=1 Tax=Vibrio chaetopteri TaxID=3016528 RepID=A0AAU8BMR8_9VIBR
MYIGKVSTLTGASERAIRLYEEMGLLKVDRQGKYRAYTQQDVEFIQLIKQAQALGVQLSELVELKDGNHDLDWRQVGKWMERKIALIDEEIQALENQKGQIKQYKKNIDDCYAALDSDSGVRV